MLKADFPQVHLIENNTNLGFWAAINRVLAVTKGNESARFDELIFMYCEETDYTFAVAE